MLTFIFINDRISLAVRQKQEKLVDDTTGFSMRYKVTNCSFKQNRFVKYNINCKQLKKESEKNNEKKLLTNNLKHDIDRKSVV